MTDTFQNLNVVKCDALSWLLHIIEQQISYVNSGKCFMKENFPVLKFHYVLLNSAVSY